MTVVQQSVRLADGQTADLPEGAAYVDIDDTPGANALFGNTALQVVKARNLTANREFTFPERSRPGDQVLFVSDATTRAAADGGFSVSANTAGGITVAGAPGPFVMQELHATGTGGQIGYHFVFDQQNNWSIVAYFPGL